MKKVTAISILLTWPLSLFVTNTFPNFINYVIPIFQPKFAILPFLFLIIYSGLKYKKLLLLSLILILISWKAFFGQTIFIRDYQKEQQILQKTFLYPNVFLARVFQNKLRIPLDKLSNNFFAITDPNNYFFGFAPRQITVDNQNLKKFPFLSLPFLLTGLAAQASLIGYSTKKIKHSKIIFAFLIAVVVNLSLLTNFDRNDFILWLPLSLVIINGLNIFNNKFPKFAKYYYVIFIIFTLIEIFRIPII